MGISYSPTGYAMHANHLANAASTTCIIYTLTTIYISSYIINILSHKHIRSCQTTTTVLVHSTNTYTTPSHGKWSLICHTSAELHTQPKQPETAQQQHRKFTILPIRVLPMPIRVLPTPDQIHTRIGHSHTRMLRVSLPHTRTTRDHFTFKIPSLSLIRVWHTPYAYHSRNTRITRVWRVPAPKPPFSSHPIRVLPSAIRVWPETRTLRSAMAFSATRSTQTNLPQSNFYTEIVHIFNTIHILFDYTKSDTFTSNSYEFFLNYTPISFIQKVHKFIMHQSNQR
jgi:hypothetical protein